MVDEHMDEVGSASSGSSVNCSDAEASGEPVVESPVFDDSKSQIESKAGAGSVSKRGVKRKTPTVSQRGCEPDASPPRGSGSQEPASGKVGIKVE